MFAAGGMCESMVGAGLSRVELILVNEATTMKLPFCERFCSGAMSFFPSSFLLSLIFLPRTKNPSSEANLTSNQEYQRRVQMASGNAATRRIYVAIVLVIPRAPSTIMKKKKIGWRISQGCVTLP